jgi:hypothetical protein
VPTPPGKFADAHCALSQDLAKAVEKAFSKLEFGTVTLTIERSSVVHIERTKRIRCLSRK